MRHDEIRDTYANLKIEVCYDQGYSEYWFTVLFHNIFLFFFKMANVEESDVAAECEYRKE